MVFGNCYCAISRLQINDGDKCILVPLGFRMNFEFNKWNKADINCFMNTYVFIDKVQEVIFEGNYAQIQYLDKEYQQAQEHELYMLLHYGFYQDLLQQRRDHFEHINNLQLFDIVYPVYEKAIEIERNERSVLLRKSLVAKNSDVYMDNWQIKTPDWIKDIYKLATFMIYMGIMPYPNLCSDQHETGTVFEKIRDKYKTGTSDK